MRIVALYKTFDGDEWLPASLASIYASVDAIVLVHSDVSWLGEEVNTCREVAERWADEHDHHRKIHHVDVRTRTQEQQYAAGIAYMRQLGIPCDAVLAVDSDEIWEPDHLERAKQQFAVSNQPAARCNMHTYLKTPFYLVDPPFGSPTVLFRNPDLLTQSPRGCQAPAVQLDDVWMHHMTYVRRSRDLVWRKVQQSCLADRDEIIVENWLENVYDRLPDGMDLHAFVRWRSVWHCVRRVWLSDLPAAVRECEFIREFLPPSLLMDGEQNELFRLAHGRRQAIDLGTFRGSSAVILGLSCERCDTVDLFEKIKDADPSSEYHELFRVHQHREEVVRKTLSRYGNITVHHEDTARAAMRFADSSVDFLFVDADHSYEGTRRNWVAWWPKLTLGARLVFHDDNPLHPGVQQAVRELDGNHIVRRVPLGPYAGSLAAFEKVAHA